MALPPIDDFRGPYRWLSNFGLDAFTWRASSVHVGACLPGGQDRRPRVV